MSAPPPRHGKPHIPGFPSQASLVQDNPNNASGLSILSSHLDIATIPDRTTLSHPLPLVLFFPSRDISVGSHAAWQGGHQHYPKLQHLLLAEPGQGPSSGLDLPKTSLRFVHIQRCPQPAHLLLPGRDVPPTLLGCPRRSRPGSLLSDPATFSFQAQSQASCRAPGPGDPLIPPWTP